MPTANTTADPLTGQEPNGPNGQDDRYDTDIGNADDAGGNNADTVKQANDDIDAGDAQDPEANNPNDYGEDETVPEASRV